MAGTIAVFCGIWIGVRHLLLVVGNESQAWRGIAALVSITLAIAGVFFVRREARLKQSNSESD